MQKCLNIIFSSAAIVLTVLAACTTKPVERIYNGNMADVTRQAINRNCAAFPLEQAVYQKGCTDTIAQLVKDYAAVYAQEFQNNDPIDGKPDNYGSFAAYNLKRTCLEGDNSLTSSLRCLKSIQALDTGSQVDGSLPHIAGRDFGYDNRGVETTFDQPVFDLLSLGTKCVYGIIHNAAAEQGICEANADQYGLDFD